MSGDQDDPTDGSVASIPEFKSILQMSHGVSDQIVDLINEVERSCYVQVAIILLFGEFFLTAVCLCQALITVTSKFTSPISFSNYGTYSGAFSNQGG